MDDLVTKLLDRLDEIERTAKAAARNGDSWAMGVDPASDPDELFAAGDLTSSGRCPEHPPGAPNLCDDSRIATADCDMAADGPALIAHAATWDPRHVLRLVAAHRELVEAVRGQGTTEELVVDSLARAYGVTEWPEWLQRHGQFVRSIQPVVIVRDLRELGTPPSS